MNASNHPTPEAHSKLDIALEAIKQFVITLHTHVVAVEFIKKNKPWRGIEQLGWILVVMAGSAALLSYQFFQQLVEVLKKAEVGTTSFAASFASTFTKESLTWAMQGSRKYLVMVVMELVVFYFIQRTLETRLGRVPQLTTRDFINAEVRIFKISILAWVQERIARLLIVDILLSILGLHALEKPFALLIQCYFLGFALVDNYHECFDLRVRESQRRTQKRALGVAIATGLAAYLLMHVPFVGAVAATMLGAVAATLAMERLAPVTELELSAIFAERKKSARKQAKTPEPTP